MIPTKPCPDCDGHGTVRTPVRVGSTRRYVDCPDCNGTGRIPDLSDYMADVLDDDNDPVEVGAVVEHVTRSAAYLRSIGRHDRADEADRYLAEVKALPGWANFQREVM